MVLSVKSVSPSRAVPGKISLDSADLLLISYKPAGASQGLVS